VLEEEAQSRVDEQIKKLEAMPPQAPDDIFTSMYEAMPPHLVEQLDQLRREVQS
jgi:TPP-dependent pyruvate/acetoin dehydrogenase alpha subunit